MTSSLTPPADPPTYVARTPVDLIALVPYVLGFHPRDSVVVLTFGSPHGSFHARVDLPHAPSERAQVVTTLREAVEGNQARTAVVLVFSDDHPAALEMGHDLVPALQAAGVDVLAAIRADGSRWWFVGPEETASAPGPGAAPSDTDPDDEAGPGQPYDVSGHPFTAARVLDGHAAFDDREALAASLRPPRGELARAERDQVAEVARREADRLSGCGLHDERLRESARWLRAQLTALEPDVGAAGADPRTTPRLPVADAARLGLLLQLPELRQVVQSTLSRRGSVAQVRFWRDLLVRMPHALVPGVAATLALAAWLAGEGALAWCAIDRCEECSADDDAGARSGRSLSTYVGQQLLAARPPGTWRAPPPDQVPLLRGCPR